LSDRQKLCKVILNVLVTSFETPRMINNSRDLALVIKFLGAIHQDITLSEKSISDSAETSAEAMARIPTVSRLLEYLPGWLWQTDSNDKFTFISPHFSAITGLSHIYFLGKSRLEIIAPDDANRPAVPINLRGHRDTLRGKKEFRNFEYEVQFHDHRHWFNISGWPIWDTQISPHFLGYVGIGQDVSLSRVRMADILEQRIYLGDAMDALAVSVLILDDEQRIEYYNNRWKQLHEGLAPEDYAKGIPYQHYLRSAIAVGLFPDAVGNEEEFVTARIEQNVHPTGRPFIVSRQRGIVLSIYVKKIAGNKKTAIISTEFNASTISAALTKLLE
jgi:two-component system cell cycle sensor histidine kinase PleC